MSDRARPDWRPLDTTAGQLLRGLRWAAVTAYLVGFGYYCYAYGVPLDRQGLLLWIAVGLLACSIGRRPMTLLWVAFDFVPLAAVLIAYDYLRGLSDTVGMPTLWHPQLDVDRFLFFGHEPTVWLQEHLKHARVQWYDVVVCVTYVSFFLLPYVTAGLLWLRSRRDFYRWSLRFVGLSLFSFLLFLVIPAAPPWAAARCAPIEVAAHPNSPACMYSGDPSRGGLLGAFTTHQPGAHPWVEQIATRGFFELHLGVADSLISEGRAIADPVAAVPSLHVGGTVLFVLFMWPRLNRWWRPLLVAYPLVMLFSLVYGGEHYVADGIAGALTAWLIHWFANHLERTAAASPARQTKQTDPDTLETPLTPPEPAQETPCPPTRPQPATTPSST